MRAYGRRGNFADESSTPLVAYMEGPEIASQERKVPFADLEMSRNGKINVFSESSSSQQGYIGFLAINMLVNYRLSSSLHVVVEPDSEGFIARCPDIPQLYGHGEDVFEAVEMLKIEIETLYDDLEEGENFSDEWLRLKEFFQKIVINEK